MDSTNHSSYKNSMKAMHYFNCPLANFWDISQSCSLFFTLLESIGREILTQLSIQFKDESLAKPYSLYQSNAIQFHIQNKFITDYSIREQWECWFPLLNKPCFLSFDIYSMNQDLSYLIIEFRFPSELNEDNTNIEQKIRKNELFKINNNILLAKYLPTHSEFLIIECDFNLALSLLIRKEICQTFIEQKRRSLSIKIPIILQITSIMSHNYFSKLKIEYEDKDIHYAQIQILQINNNELYIILTHFFVIRSSCFIQEKYSNLAKMFINNLKKTLNELNPLNKIKQTALLHSE